MFRSRFARPAPFHRKPDNRYSPLPRRRRKWPDCTGAEISSLPRNVIGNPSDDDEHKRRSGRRKATAPYFTSTESLARLDPDGFDVEIFLQVLLARFATGALYASTIT